MNGSDKIKKIEYITISLNALAAVLCSIGNMYASPIFVIAASIGLYDAVKNKVISPAIISGLYLTLNIVNTVKMFF